MTQINLLPWREQERQVKKIIFGLTLGAFVILTIVLSVFVHIYLKMQIGTQVERGAYLQSVMDQTQTDILGLKDKATKQAKIISRLELIINLRGKSFNAVHVLNLLINTVPKTIFLQKVSCENKIITIEGSTDSDLQTTLFMRNIEAIKGFKQPVLNVINVQKTVGSTGETRHFQIKVEQQE
jgi:type IV pilus assembly protein PilN